MEGLWEFPGGKVEENESPEAALVREFSEELDVAIEVGDPMTFAFHEEPGLRILLLFYAARIGAGTPHPQEGEAIAWVPPSELDRYSTPPADATLVRQLADSQQVNRRSQRRRAT